MHSPYRRGPQRRWGPYHYELLRPPKAERVIALEDGRVLVIVESMDQVVWQSGEQTAHPSTGE